MLACPADRTKRSRLRQVGSVGACRRKRVHRAKAIGAAPIGAPGWPDLAFWTPSIDSVRMVSMGSRSSPFAARVMAVGLRLEGEAPASQVDVLRNAGIVRPAAVAS